MNIRPLAFFTHPVVARPDSNNQPIAKYGGNYGLGLPQPHSNMASLSRRACYKCGNVGHYAEVCSSAERLCYNCKQPGHESNACPHPRTTETKQCYHCQGVGHVQADCPTLRLSGAATSGVCYTCGQPGHLARSCPSGGMGRGVGRGVAPPPRGGYAGFRGGFNGSARAATCYKCGGPNHYARDCQAQSMKCYACGKLGHISRDCTAPNGGPLNTVGKTCYRCGEAGHISRECPQADHSQDAAVMASAGAPNVGAANGMVGAPLGANPEASASVAPQPTVVPTAAAA